MSQNEPVENAIREIDRYVEAMQPHAGAARALTADGHAETPGQVSLSQRLQALGQQKIGTFMPLLDFQNAQSVQEAATPLLPNEF